MCQTALKNFTCKVERGQGRDRGREGIENREWRIENGEWKSEGQEQGTEIRRLRRLTQII